METIKLSVKQMKEIVFDESEDFEIVQNEIVGSWRHGDVNECVVERLSDGKFFMIEYRDSPKDSAMFEDMNDGGTFYEVVPKEVTKIVYVKAS